MVYSGDLEKRALVSDEFFSSDEEDLALGGCVVGEL